MGTDGQHTEMDRWKLSRDSNTLTIRRQVVSLRGEMESTLVYERQPEDKQERADPEKKP